MQDSSVTAEDLDAEDLDDDVDQSLCTWTANHAADQHPEWSDAETTLRVRQSCPSMLVEISDIVTHPESWGRELAAIACVITPTLAEENDMTPDAALALIKQGFNSGENDPLVRAKWHAERLGDCLADEGPQEIIGAVLPDLLSRLSLRYADEGNITCECALDLAATVVEADHKDQLNEATASQIVELMAWLAFDLLPNAASLDAATTERLKQIKNTQPVFAAES